MALPLPVAAAVPAASAPEPPIAPLPTAPPTAPAPPPRLVDDRMEHRRRRAAAAAVQGCAAPVLGARLIPDLAALFGSEVAGCAIHEAERVAGATFHVHHITVYRRPVAPRALWPRREETRTARRRSCHSAAIFLVF